MTNLQEIERSIMSLQNDEKFLSGNGSLNSIMTLWD